MTKKVIFVGGTIFSGSTFFHLTLANDPKGFSVGEVRHLFRPMNERHNRSIWVCHCGDPNCDLWDRVEKNGINHLYESIFEIHPEVDFIVDSSKDIVWIDSQTNRLAQQGIEAKHILIWKTLAEFGHSLHKRSRLEIEDGKHLALWPRYHRGFYSFFNDFGAVKYKSYTKDLDATLQAACDYLDIPYFEGKEQFWEKKHHSLGGNLTARIHLYSKESSNYQDVVERSKGGAQHYDIGVSEDHHREIFYDKPDEKAVQSYITRLHQQMPTLSQVEEMLLSRDVANPDGWHKSWPELQASGIEIRKRRIASLVKEMALLMRFKIRYAN